jgi:hypothetical protein
MAQYMNMTVEEEGDELVIRVKHLSEGRPSGSGKTTTIATTGKPKAVAVDPKTGQDIYLGVNCFRYPPR